MRDKKVIIVGVLASLVVILICILVLITSSISTKQRSANQTADSASTISLISPTGAPALSLAGVVNDDTFALDYEIVDGSDVLSAAFMSGESDLIIAPINLGLSLIENGANYSLLGVVSWGNLYVVSNSSSYSGSIAAFGQNAISGLVLEYVQSEFTGSISIDWYSSVSEVAQLLLQGEYSAALLAEPVLSSVLEADDSFSILYDIQELYTEISGNDTYPQAAIFVNNSSITTKTEVIVELCNKIDMTITSFNNDPSTLLTLDIDFSELGFADVDLLVDAYERMALDFVYACDDIENITAFLALFDITLDETMYVK